MPGPGSYVTDPKTGNIKRKPGSVKRDPSGNVTAVETVTGWVSPAGGPSSTSYPTAAGAVAKTKEVSATAKLKEYRKQAEKIVDSKVEFDTYDGLPKLKSAASSVAHASAKVGKASGSGKAKTDGNPPVPKGQLTELKKVEGTKFNAMDPALKKNSVTGLSEKKQKAFKKATGDSTLDDTLKELASVDSFKASAGHMKDALDDVVSGEKSPGQAYASVLLPGQDNSISPADRANVALTLFGAAGALKGAKVASKVPGAVRAEKAADESLNTYKALKAAARTQAKKTRTGRTLVKVRDASTSKTGRAVKAAAYTGAGAEATRRGYTQAFVEGNLNADVGKTVGATAKVALGMPAAMFGIGANSALTAKRALVAPLEDNPEKQSSEYILGPTKTLAEENLKAAKKMLDVYTSGDAKRVEKYTENVAGYFPLVTGANVFSRGLLPGSRMVGEGVTKVAREAKDSHLRGKNKMAPRPADEAPLPVFPKLADAKKHVKIKRRVARSGTSMIQGENIGTNDMRGEVSRSNWGAAKKVDKALAPLREKMYARYPGRKNTIDSVVSIPALAQFLGAEARVSQRSVSEALAQLDNLEEAIKANPKAKDGAPMLLQIEALKEHPYLMKRPPEKLTAKMLRDMTPTERREVKAARTLWRIADARNLGADLTSGIDRSKHAREVSDAFAVEALSGKKTLPPEFKLDRQRAAEQTAIDAARKSVRSDQSKTRTLYKDLSVQRKKVERDRMAEANRLKIPGRKPSKRLAQAEAKLARMEAEFAGHTEKVKSDILSVRQRQNTLDARLTPDERKAVLASLPPDATVSEKKVALGTARKDKMEAEQAKALEPIREEFDQQMEAAMAKYGIDRSNFIIHRTAQEMEKAPSAGSFDRIGAVKDKRRTGELLRTGEAVFDYQAAIQTIRDNVKREEDARMVRALTEDHSYSTDLGNGKQNLFTPDEEQKMLDEGRLIPGTYERVRAALLNDEETLSSILGSKDPESALRDLMDKDRRGQLDIQALDAKGQGDRFYLMDAKAVTYTLDSMKALDGVFKWMNWINGIGSRVVLNTSFAWMVAQPIAETLVLLMHDPNPARIIRAMKVVKDAHKDPELMKALARGSDSALAREGLKQDNKAYQGQSYDAAKVLKKSPVGMLASDIASLRAPAYIDRAKGGWIRKVGYAAEVDRELNSTVRQFGRAVAGTMDDIESVSGKLRKMDRKAQLKWLDTPEGRLAAEKLQSNLDGMLGNWGALGPKERQIAQLVFFYPFMRYSLDWMFHTFPKRHPIRYALFTSMSAWNAQQVEEFLGHKPSFFSGWAESPIYGGKDGEATSTLPFARATPAGNTLVELFGDADSLGALSKGFSPALKPFSLIFNYDSFGKPRSDPGYGSSGDTGLASSFGDLLSNAKEQAIGMSFPGRYADRLLSGRDAQPGDEGPTQIGPLSVDTYGLRSGAFPFMPHDKKQASVGAAVSDAYDKRGEAYGQSNAGGDRYSELNKRFEGMADWARPTAAESKDYREYTDLKKQRAEGTKNIAKQEAKLRALYRQEGIPVPDNLKSDATVADWAQKGGTLSKKEQAAIDKALRPLSPDRIEAAARTTTPKAIKAGPKAKMTMANKILDAKAALRTGGTPAALTKPTIPASGQTFGLAAGKISIEQAKLMNKVLSIGDEMGATDKQKLSAVETAIIESGIANLGSGDADSAGWRQERAMYYDNPTNVEDSARRYFEEAQAADSPDLTPGLLAQATQQSAFGEKYDLVENQAKPLLAAYEKSKTFKDPQAKQKFARLVRRGKAMGVYEDAAKKKTIDWSNAEKAKRFVRGAAEVLPKRKIDKWLLPSGSGSGGIENIYKLNPVLARQLIKVAQESGEPITVDSGQRSTEYQANIDSGTNPKAPPGLSSHQFGMAADTSMTPAQVEIAAKYGIEHGEAGAGVADPPHTELTDPALIKEALKHGPIRSSYLPAGVADSVGDVDSWEGGDAVVINPGSVMDQVKAARAPDPVATGSTSQTAGSTTTTSFPSASTPSGNTSDRQAPYNQRMNKWQKLMDFRADPTGTTGATSGTASDSTMPDLSAAEQIANLPSTKRKKNYV